ncbi:MAG TPA: HAD-IIA family hydrolase [Anaerolineales bacterium]|nr:HAD-IIA family hydrolase [Anaerolineales bacterium]
MQDPPLQNMIIPSSIKALILDIDGVLWHNRDPIIDLPAVFKIIEKRGYKVTLATNNSTRTAEETRAQINSFGINLAPSQVITSSIATAALLKEHFLQSGDLYILGMKGIIKAVEEKGFRVFTDGNIPEKPLAVVVGMDWDFNYDKIAEAALLIQQGIPFYATNPDKTFPTSRGLLPGIGTLLSAVSTAALDVKPIIAGKPEPYLFQLAMQRMNVSPEETLVVGDRLETDILGGQNAGCKTACVLSGVTERARAESWVPKVDFIAEDLAALLRE